MDVKSAKIVAGSEVERTNKLLNELAKAVLDKKPFVEAVEKVRKGQKPPEAAAASSSTASTSKTTAAAAKKAPVASKAPTKAAPVPANRGGKTGPASKAPQSKVASKAAPISKKAETTQKAAPPKKPPTPEPEPEAELSTVPSSETAESEKSLESSSVAAKSLKPDQAVKPSVSVDDKIDENNLDTTEQATTTAQISSKPNSANLESSEIDNLDEPMINNNIDNNLDQLVAGLGLDDDDDEEEEDREEEVLRDANQQNANPEDSGIDSKASSNHSVSNNHSAKSVAEDISPPGQEIQATEPAESTIKEGTPLPPPSRTDRKRSATIKSSRRRASKSGLPANQMMNGMGSSRSQNVPSSAAPASYAAVAASLPPSNVPPPPYEEEEDFNLGGSTAAPPPSAAVRQMSNGRLTTARSSARPSSSRPAPPRVKTASRSRPPLGLLAENRAGEQVGGDSLPEANQQVWPPPEVLALDLDLDDKIGEDEEAAAAAADEYVMSSQKLQDALFRMDSTDGATTNGTADLSNSNNNQGRLVQQLMETKSELEGNVALGGAKKTAESQVNGTGSTDTKVLRGRVQELCQSVGALSKALNYLHEDVEPIIAELGKWREEYRTNSRAIERLQGELAKEVEPLRRQLEAEELEVRQAAERLLNAKAAVQRNALTIARMIEGV